MSGDIAIDLGPLRIVDPQPSPYDANGQHLPALADLYSSLPVPTGSRSIRVLDLKLSRDDDKPLTGNLRVVSLAQSPKFRALSYVWGDPTSSHTISVNGTEVSITSNCRDVLIAVRRYCTKTPRIRRTVTIWVDSICINQQDIHERGAQIQFMGEIYSWATEVIIWLGPGSNNTYDTFQYLRGEASYKICLQAAEYKSMPTICLRAIAASRLIVFLLFFPIAPLIYRWSSRKKYVSLFQPYHAEQLNQVLDTMWITRSWTFQEILLARNPVIFCGHEHLSWDELLRSLECVQDEHQKGLSSHRLLPTKFQSWVALCNLWMNTPRRTHWNGQKMRRPLPDGTSSVALHLQNFQKSGFSKTILEISLLLLWLISCTIVTFLMWMPPLNPWESNLGLLIYIFIIVIETACFNGVHIWANGTARNARRLICTTHIQESNTDDSYLILQGLIRALYDRTTSYQQDQAYATYGVLQMLEVTLTPVCYENPTGRVYHDFYSDLLSWKPSLINLIVDSGESSTMPHKPTWVPDWSKSQKKPWLSENYRYPTKHSNTATPESVAWVRISRKGRRKLHVKAQVFGRTTFSSGSFMRNDRSPDALINRVAVFWIRLLAILQDKAPLVSSYESLRCALFETVEARRYQQASDEARGFDATFSIFSDVIMATSDQNDYGSQAEEALRRLFEEPLALAYFIDICVRLGTERRNLFSLQSGHIGTGSPGMAEGDVIALIAGVPIPMVLRSRGDSQVYVVVGPAIVYGIMEGEEFDESKLEPMTLV